MELEPREWPVTRWQLTAPESYVLQVPRPLQAVQAFKFALRELVLRRALQLERLENAGLIGRRRPKSLLRPGSAYASISEPALAPLLALHADTPQSRADGVLVEDFARAARRAFTRSLAGYIDDHVYPSLARRGLIEVKESRPMGLFRRRTQALTPAGREAAAELEEWLRSATRASRHGLARRLSARFRTRAVRVPRFS